jgi:hypothetical protein
MSCHSNSRRPVRPFQGPSAKTLSQKIITALPGLDCDFGKREQHTPFAHIFVLNKIYLK